MGRWEFKPKPETYLDPSALLPPPPRPQDERVAFSSKSHTMGRWLRRWETVWNLLKCDHITDKASWSWIGGWGEGEGGRQGKREIQRGETGKGTLLSGPVLTRQPHRAHTRTTHPPTSDFEFNSRWWLMYMNRYLFREACCSKYIGLLWN